MNDVHVDPTSASSDIPSPISQNPALDGLLTQPTAADEAEVKDDAAVESAYICPTVLACICQCSKAEEGVVRGDKVGWVCHWCGKWFAGRHPTLALCHITRSKMKRGIVPCSGNIDPESCQRYVCCYVSQYCFVPASLLFTWATTTDTRHIGVVNSLAAPLLGSKS